MEGWYQVGGGLYSLVRSMKGLKLLEMRIFPEELNEFGVVGRKPATRPDGCKLNMEDLYYLFPCSYPTYWA